jgi:hypothetical protein
MGSPPACLFDSISKQSLCNLDRSPLPARKSMQRLPISSRITWLEPVVRPASQSRQRLAPVCVIKVAVVPTRLGCGPGPWRHKTFTASFRKIAKLKKRKKNVPKALKV